MSVAEAVLKSESASLDARRRLILTAAYELLDGAGLDGLTIRAVLQRTGLARRAFYECFAEKDDLMLAVFAHTIGSAVAAYGEAMAPFADPLERLKLIVTSIVLERAPGAAPGRRSSRRGAALAREHLRLGEARPGDLQAALAPLIALIAQQLSAGMASGQVREADPQRLATLVYNLVSTTVHTELLASERGDRARREQLAGDIWEFCRRALAG